MLEVTVGFSAVRLGGGLLLATLFSAAAWRAGALSTTGALAAAIIGGFVYGFAGLPWAILMVAFFASSSMLSRLFTGRKREVMQVFAKGERRDHAQVLANGGAAALALIGLLLGLVPISLAWVAFAASLATVNADTWATELGVLSSSSPRLVTTGRKVSPGTSGGVSLLGSLAALGGAFLVAFFAALLLRPLNLIPLVALLTLIGFIGSYADSLLGATVQAIYYCPECEKETERYPMHPCGAETIHRRGWRWLNNDWVNFLSSFVSAFMAAGLFVLLGMG
jgi:uncharacterized protein (TIGR00297 family)